MFLSLNPFYGQDIFKVSLARWLVEVIRGAYEGVGVSEAFEARAHEVRAWASSLAFAHSIPLSEVMQSSVLESQGAFAEFYLRDVSRLREDGSRGIQSLVVAQSVISSRSGVSI